MNNNNYQQILKVLESNDTRCTDDRADREALAFVRELFLDVLGTTKLGNVK